MKYLMIAAASLALVACGGAKDKANDAAGKAADSIESTADAAADAAGDAVDAAADAADAAGDTVDNAIDGALDGVSRADWVNACASADTMTTEKCECTLDAYEDMGLEYKDMDNADKMTEVMTNATPAQLTAVSSCIM